MHHTPRCSTIWQGYSAGISTATDYSAFGAPLPGRSGSGYRYGFNGQEKVEELGASHTTAMFWEYDGRLGRRWNPDPVLKHHESPYAAFANNPIFFVDPSGADTSKLTGSSNLMIFIQDGKAKIDYDKMVSESGDWDFVVVENMQGAQNLLKQQYGDQTGFIENLVVKSHGAAYKGPDLDNASGTGVVHNPAGDASMMYVRSLLTHSANVCFTACSVIQGYNDPNHPGYKTSRETAKNFSEFFLKGTRRNLFMNYTKSTSVGYTDANTNGSLDAGESYWFRFNSPLVAKKEQWAGFMWFYYGQSGTWLKQKNYYQLIVESGGMFSDGGVQISPIKPIDPKSTVPNTELPKKTGL